VAIFLAFVTMSLMSILTGMTFVGMQVQIHETLFVLEIAEQSIEKSNQMMSRSAVAKFINIFCTRFLYESAFCRQNVTREKHFRTKKARKNCWWNWHLELSSCFEVWLWPHLRKESLDSLSVNENKNLLLMKYQWRNEEITFAEMKYQWRHL